MPVPEPVAFTIFHIDVMWYGILVTAGIAIGTWISYLRAPKHGIDSDKFLNMVIISVPCGIIGARLYYVLFNWAWYAGDLGRIVNIRQGGLAIHGGLIAGLGVAFILCMIYKIRPLELFDLLAPSIAIGQAIGRWGNYFNSEAHGGPTDLPWAVTVDGITYHPTFLYESLWCFFLFCLLLFIDRNRKFEGQIICLYGILYSVERFFVEALRTDSLMIGPMKQAQVISIVIIGCCAILYFVLSTRAKRAEKKA